LGPDRAGFAEGAFTRLLILIGRPGPIGGLAVVDIFAPTSTSAQQAIFRPEIEMDGTRTLVLVDQIEPPTPAASETSQAAMV
jgi:hypothetical protein